METITPRRENEMSRRLSKERLDKEVADKKRKATSRNNEVIAMSTPELEKQVAEQKGSVQQEITREKKTKETRRAFSGTSSLSGISKTK